MSFRNWMRIDSRHKVHASKDADPNLSGAKTLA
jgi:hypothetical protein